jgi:hypothetical protein
MVFALLAANFFVGDFVARSVGRCEHATLPMFNLLSGDGDMVLGAGCGAGRITIALGSVLWNGSIRTISKASAGGCSNRWTAPLRVDRLD